MFCYESKQILAPRGVDTSDTVLCVGKLSNGGTIFLGSSWAYPDSFTRDLDFTVRLLGTQGLLEGQLFGQSLMLHADRPRVLDYQFADVDPAGRRDNWWTESTRYFLHCLNTGLPPTPDVEDGLACLRVLRDGRVGADGEGGGPLGAIRGQLPKYQIPPSCIATRPLVFR